MALVTISGYPCSGKSTRANQLAAYFEKRLGEAGYDGPRLRVALVDDEGSHVERAVYDGGSKATSSWSHPILEPVVPFAGTYT
ncbi:hypothetical protein EHS25_001278 [Saitozyma podzolica]|jgi:protein KTI12|uniref:Uncharacterized protein n=1 Tax=Saitozyma podzolica TaxID=1890683 RepID=A0A427YHW8_9TREE|nr:hypothetical protein EHS25_001278 [Saitozyma podzolica]